MTFDIVKTHENTFQPFFYTLAGSRLVGMHTDASDYDYIGTTVEPPEYVIGLRKFEQHEWKDPDNQSEGVTYSLKKYVSLLLKGNPTILSTAFSNQAHDVLGVTNPTFHALFVSKKAGNQFLGYLNDQIRRLHNSTGMHVVRAELIKKFGYDTKYASHIIRLGLQGVEYMNTGTITLPMRQDHINLLLDIRNGALSYHKFKDLADRSVGTLESVCGFSSLPDAPQYDKVNRWLVDTYQNIWHEWNYNL
jgi:predicted nucleotidyltransferase